MRSDPLLVLSGCSGVSGLDHGVQAALALLGHESKLIGFIENDPAPSAVLAHHYPDVPNYGDLKVFAQETVPGGLHSNLRPDVFTSGYPCQPFSTAGMRRGEDDPRHLWPYVRAIICNLRPRLTLCENVAGHRSKGFGTVLGDMAEDGFDVRWTSIRASEAGAAHRRERIFLAITPHAADLGREVTLGDRRDGEEESAA